MALTAQSSGSAGHSRCCPLARPAPVPLNESFGQFLARLLRERGISQYRLCQLTGLGADTVCRLVNDIRNPTEAQVLRICLGLHLATEATNRLLEAADLYPMPEETRGRASGKTGWSNSGHDPTVGIASITRPSPRS